MHAVSRKRHAFVLAPVLLCFAAAIAVLHPFADLTYGGDDWAYAWSVQRMVLEHKLITSSWVAATCVPQILWGSAFCKLLGLSFRTMNIATIAFSFIGPVFAYFTLLELGLKEKQATLVTFFLTLSPHYLSYACSFMSDMHYAVLLLGAVMLYVRGLLRQSRGYLLVGSVVASLALMQRQIGVTVPAALVCTLIIAVIARRRRLESAVAGALLAAVLPLLTVLAMRVFPDAFGGITRTQVVKMNSAAMLERFEDVAQSIAHAYTALVYTAVLSLPLLLACSLALLRSLSTFRSWLQRALVSVLLLVALAAFAAAMLGHGALVVEGEFLHPVALPPVGETLWLVLVGLGSLAFPVVIALASVRAFMSLSARLPRIEAEPNDAALGAIFLALTLLFHWALVATFIAFYNNYFLPLMLLAGLLIAYALRPELNRPSGRSSWALPVLAAVLAFAGAVLPADLLVRYVEADNKLTDALTAQGTPDARIFGYPGSYPRRNYEIADRETKKNPWGLFGRLRMRASVILVPAGLAVAARWPRKVSSHTYQTLLGERTIDVWEKALPRPRPRKHPRKHPRVRHPPAGEAS